MAPVLAVGRAGYFYPRSPCGERRRKGPRRRVLSGISIHALLAESDSLGLLGWLRVFISIHALLAESDEMISIERCSFEISIHALLAESDADRYEMGIIRQISIHALLAESDRMFASLFCGVFLFLSTLSLRRATR